MVSMATAVLPVCLSPMISSRWPRPMGTRLWTAWCPLVVANGHQAVHSLDSSLHRLLDRLPGDDARGLESNSVPLLAADGALAVNGVTQGIDNTSKDLVTNGNIHNCSSSLDNVSLLDELVITENDNTNVVGLQVEGHAFQSRAKFHHFLCLDILQA